MSSIIVFSTKSLIISARISLFEWNCTVLWTFGIYIITASKYTREEKAFIFIKEGICIYVKRMFILKEQVVPQVFCPYNGIQCLRIQCLVTSILQNILFFVPLKKEMLTGLEQSVWANYDRIWIFGHTISWTISIRERVKKVVIKN